MKTIAIFGAGGHTKVIIDLISQLKHYKISGIYDDTKQGLHQGVPILGKIDSVTDCKFDEYVIGIGDDIFRKQLYNRYNHLNWSTLIHPRAIVSETSNISPGTVVFAGAVIQAEVTIGRHCIINTNCNIDHECTIGDFTSICPGVTICGKVTVGQATIVGANATIIPDVNIGNNCTIGAGSVIINDIDNDKTVVGVPGKILNKSNVIP